MDTRQFDGSDPVRFFYSPIDQPEHYVASSTSRGACDNHVERGYNASSLLYDQCHDADYLVCGFSDYIRYKFHEF